MKQGMIKGFRVLYYYFLIGVEAFSFSLQLKLYLFMLQHILKECTFFPLCQIFLSLSSFLNIFFSLPLAIALSFFSIVTSREHACVVSPQQKPFFFP
jgi:hypothetical protein